MQLKIQNGVVDLSGEPILKSVNIEINDNSRIAVVGRNGCGKTTLLKLIAGEYSIVKRDSDENAFFSVSGSPKIGLLSQMTFLDDSVSMLEEIRSAYSEILEIKEKMNEAQEKMEEDQTEENIKIYTNLLDTFTNLGGFYFEKEYELALKRFGFSEEEKQKPLYEFSGGQRTKIAFLKLLLSKPDILLLDEPTNHLDIDALEWLENYLKEYKKAFVVVSHDRMFLDNIANTVYEIENGKTHRFVGNYSQFVVAKKALYEQQLKQYEAQKKEIKRLEELVERFRYKPTKAAMAQSKLKQIEKMVPIEAPEAQNNKAFRIKLDPKDLGIKDMLSIKDLSVGYDEVLTTLSLEVKKGDKIGIIGANGLGKSTFIKTLVGKIKALSGSYKFADRAKIGYFDQQMAQYQSDDTVLEDFLKQYPYYTEFEARSCLGAFLFSGEDVFKTVNMLSGGEKVRLALCKILNSMPNFLILDEPTNHMDIIGKEALEEILREFEGTIIFVSHDRYFIKKVAESILDFKKGKAFFYEFGYDDYLRKQSLNQVEQTEEIKPQKEKKSYTTPLKEKSKIEKAIKQSENKIAELEERLEELERELLKEENISDYIKLSQLGDEKAKLESELEETMLIWEENSQKLSEMMKN